MTFDLKKTNQCLDIERSFQAFVFKHLYQSSDSVWVRFTSLPVSAICSTTRTCARVAIIGEALIKALSNIFGSICQIDGCSFDTGLVQILDIPKYIFNGIFDTLGEVIAFAVAVFGIAVDPKGITKDLWLANDPDEVNRQNFENLLKKHEDEPENEQHLYNLACFYEQGSPAYKNEKLAFEFYTELANKNTHSEVKTNALMRMGIMYENGVYVKQDIDQAYTFYELAANRNEYLTNTMEKLGEYYEKRYFHESVDTHRVKAEDWYTKSGQVGSLKLISFKQKLKKT